ncbi:hypothetical protein BD779DRAFT_1475187 [Infundibulicybe gibba]|nr:hypothetical protein BD779DRAFT_1475187 [Infundibulicybe gibba]
MDRGQGGNHVDDRAGEDNATGGTNGPSVFAADDIGAILKEMGYRITLSWLSYGLCQTALRGRPRHAPTRRGAPGPQTANALIPPDGGRLSIIDFDASDRDVLLEVAQELMDDTPAKRPMMADVLERMDEEEACGNAGSEYLRRCIVQGALATVLSVPATNEPATRGRRGHSIPINLNLLQAEAADLIGCTGFQTSESEVQHQQSQTLNKRLHILELHARELTKRGGIIDSIDFASRTDPASQAQPPALPKASLQAHMANNRLDGCKTVDDIR